MYKLRPILAGLGCLSLAWVGSLSTRAQTLEPFHPIPDGYPTSAATAADGTVIVGGTFTAISGEARLGLARLNTDGSVASDITAGITAGTQVTAILEHPDGTNYIGGAFSAIAGAARGNLARLAADGTLDAGFTTGANASVSALALQADGRILVGGAFTMMGGAAHVGLARLNANGTVDGSFAPAANAAVNSIIIQPDGSIIIAGLFTEVNGSVRNRLARLAADGTLDASFDPDADGQVTGMAQQADGKLLVYGLFTNIGGVAREHYARLNADGSLDTTFVLPANSSIDSMTAQADGKILVAGNFTGGSVTGPAIIRVNGDGSLDAGFTPIATNGVAHLVPNGDGQIYVAGLFTTFMGEARQYLAMITNPTTATQSLTVDSGGNVNLTLAGSTPIPSVVRIDSTVNGTTWTDIGMATYSGGVWTLAGPVVPTDATQLRAHAIVPANGSDSSEMIVVAALGAPMITVDPVAQMIDAGDDLVLSVTADGTGTLSYQWRRDGVDIAGATSSTLTITNAQPSDSGTYTVVVTNSEGSIESAGAAVTISGDVGSRLLNMSTRARVGTGADVTIPGFVIAGTGTKKLLIRAVGPSLNPLFGLNDVLPDPQITLKKWNPAIAPDGAYEDVASNDEWMDNANAAEIETVRVAVGGFGFRDDHEAALLVDLEPGQYTVVASGVGDTEGIGLVELYDADEPGPSAELINMSNRGYVGVGDEVMIPGFVISEEGPKTILMRVVGPTLADLGVTGPMADPKLTLHRQLADGTFEPIATQDNWSDDPDAATTASVAAEVFAFSLPDGSTDAAMVATLDPGIYTVIGESAVDGGTGVVLVELYVVP